MTAKILFCFTFYLGKLEKKVYVQNILCTKQSLNRPIINVYNNKSQKATKPFINEKFNH